MPKKYRECKPRGSQNDAKMDTKSIDFSYFVEKRQKRSRPFVFPHNSWFWALKMRAKSIRNQHKIDARKNNKKHMEHYAKMGPKRSPNGSRNRLKIRKKREKRHAENDAGI